MNNEFKIGDIFVDSSNALYYRIKNTYSNLLFMNVFRDHGFFDVFSITKEDFIDFIKTNQLSKLKLENSFKECSHEWENYVGFTETYKYCSKCDVKEV